MATKITAVEYQEARTLNMGFCTNCNKVAGECVEPDAQNYNCDSCDNDTVQGIENALIGGLIEVG